VPVSNLFRQSPGSSNWPIGVVLNSFGALFAGVLGGYLGGVIVYGLLTVASRRRGNRDRPGQAGSAPTSSVSQ
jgi:hypothetical protein